MQEVDYIELSVVGKRMEQNVNWLNDRIQSYGEYLIGSPDDRDPEQGLIKAMKESEKDLKRIKELLIDMEILKNEC